MTDQGPVGEAMSREGKGTGAGGEAGSSRPIRWEEAVRRLTKGGWFWLVTVGPDGAPHQGVRPPHRRRVLHPDPVALRLRPGAVTRPTPDSRSSDDETS